MLVERDKGGRWPAGTTGNPKGRRPVSALAKLVEAATAAGAEVTIRVPPRPASDDDAAEGGVSARAADPMAQVRAAVAQAVSALRAAIEQAEERVEQARRELAEARGAATIGRAEAEQLVDRIVGELAGPPLDVGPFLAGSYVEAARVRNVIAGMPPSQLVAALFADQLRGHLMDRLDKLVEARGG